LPHFAKREGVSPSYFTLSYLDPDITQAILDGRQPRDLTADKLLAHSRLPLAWHGHRHPEIAVLADRPHRLWVPSSEYMARRGFRADADCVAPRCRPPQFYGSNTVRRGVSGGRGQLNRCHLCSDSRVSFGLAFCNE
jgi:hypothetical protein